MPWVNLLDISCHIFLHPQNGENKKRRFCRAWSFCSLGGEPLKNYKCEVKHCPCRFCGEPLTCRWKLFSVTADLWKQHLFQGLLGIWNEAMWLWFWGVVGLTRRLTQLCKKYHFLSIQKPAWGSDAKRPDSTKLANTFISVILASFYSTSLWRHIERGAGAHFSVIIICLWSSVPTQIPPQTPLQTHRHTHVLTEASAIPCWIPLQLAALYCFWSMRAWDLGILEGCPRSAV